MERTFAMVKPDGVRRGQIGEVIGRLEKKGIEIVAIRYMNISRELAEQHYAEHRDKAFFTELVDFIISGPVVAMVLQGENIIVTVRNMMGATDPKEAAPGTIRGDLAVSIDQNVIHGSDSPASAAREIELFFSAQERLR